MDQVAENEEKSFEHYFEVPDRVRTRIINRMRPDDRVRMTRCSKLCDKEAKASPNYVHEVRLSCDSADSIRIAVAHQKSDVFHERRGFLLQFFKRREMQIMRYRSLNTIVDNNRMYWNTKLDESKSLIQHVMDEFRKIMKICQNSVKILRLDDFHQNVLENVDLGIDLLENLKILETQGPIDIRPILTKLSRPLETLAYKDNDSTVDFSNFEQVYQVKRGLVWWNSNLSNGQFLRLSAEAVFINIGELTEKDIFHFIRSWQNGTIGKEINFYEWRLQNPNFDVQILLRLLRVYENEGGVIEIKHYIQPGKSAKFRWGRFSLQFNGNLENIRNQLNNFFL